MSSIRRRTAALVALSMAGLLAVGGLVLDAVLRRALTAQFDDALRARAAALQSLITFDGRKVEIDLAPNAARDDVDGLRFMAWAGEGDQWRVLGRSGAFRAAAGSAEPSPLDPLGTRDMLLADGIPGRAILTEFLPIHEHDEDAELDDPGETGGMRLAVAPGSAPPRVRVLIAVPRTGLDVTIARIGWSIAGVGGVLALASIAASRWTVARGLAPLHDLSARVQTIGPDTLGTRFDATGLPTELRPIAEQLGSLLGRLDAAFQREQRFAAAASHELRTPIAELRMLLEVASSQPRTSEEWSRTAATGLGVLAGAQSLCESLLRLSRASSGHAAPDVNSTSDTGAVVNERAAAIARLHPDGTDRIRVDCPAKLTARIDPASLSSIVGNVIENALRHGDATTESPVRIVARQTGEQIRIEISNPARNFSGDDLNHLFEPFWRKDSAPSARRGHGMGLPVARALARAAGGEVTARLDGPGMFVAQIVLKTPV